MSFEAESARAVVRVFFFKETLVGRRASFRIALFIASCQWFESFVLLVCLCSSFFPYDVTLFAAFHCDAVLVLVSGAADLRRRSCPDRYVPFRALHCGLCLACPSCNACAVSVVGRGWSSQWATVMGADPVRSDGWSWSSNTSRRMSPLLLLAMRRLHEVRLGS